MDRVAVKKSLPEGRDSAPSGIELEELLHRGYRYALSLTHDENRAEDLLQDAFVSILRRGGHRSAAYLNATIRNRFIDLYRRERLVVMQRLEETGEEAMLALDADDSWVDPELLDQALGTLRPQEREAIYLATVEDYTAREIADFTGRPRGTVLSLLHRARAKLRAFFEAREMQP